VIRFPTAVGERRLRVDCGHLHIGERPRRRVSALGYAFAERMLGPQNALGRTSANCAGESFVTRYASSKKVHSSKQSLAGNVAGKTLARLHNTANLLRKRLEVESSPGHSSIIFFYNQQVITIHPENQTVCSVPPRVGRSVREPPQDGTEYKTIELIALRLRDALRRRVLSTPSDDGEV